MPTDKHLLEIGSGTGQHAVFMAPYFPYLKWHAADLLENHKAINQWIDEAKLPNLMGPIIYESGKSTFPDLDVDVVFTANTLHIMSWQNVQILIEQWGQNLKNGAQIIIYGPFNYAGNFTSESNAKFDVWLKEQGQHRGIRDFEAIVELMKVQGIKLIEDFIMPSNNRVLHFKKTSRNKSQ